MRFPFLKGGMAPRDYQIAIADSALSKGNTLVVLPTGLGKTLIAFLVIAEKAKSGRAAFLAPTKPLVQQHYRTFLESVDFPPEQVSLITGESSPKKREELWKGRICFSTPQSLQNDLKAGRTSADFSLCIIDEAHRAVGSYAYTFVAGEAAKRGALILGLTASPGGSRARIEEIVGALGISNIEIRTHDDSDVSPFVKPLEVSFIRVGLGSEFSEARRLLSGMLSDSRRGLESFGFHAPLLSKKKLVELRVRIMRSSDRVKYAALSFYSTTFNLVHMLELIETQGLATFLSYVEKLKGRPETRARRRIFSDPRFSKLMRLCQSASEHPKLSELVKLLSERRGEKVLVFAQYRDQVKTIVEALRRSGFSAERFVGKKEGVTSEEQKRTVERFAAGEFDAMVATSIGEEGLDIPSVDSVVFFEPVASEIRSIQRRGRAGRLKAGRVFILITTGTRDEAYFHAARKKEDNMRRIVGSLQLQFGSAKRGALPSGKTPYAMAGPRALQSAPNSGAKEGKGGGDGRKSWKTADAGLQTGHRKPHARRGPAVQKKLTDF